MKIKVSKLKSYAKAQLKQPVNIVLYFDGNDVSLIEYLPVGFIPKDAIEAELMYWPKDVFDQVGYYVGQVTSKEDYDILLENISYLPNEVLETLV